MLVAIAADRAAAAARRRAAAPTSCSSARRCARAATCGAARSAARSRRSVVFVDRRARHDHRLVHAVAGSEARSARSRSSRTCGRSASSIVPNLIFIGALLCLLAVTTRRLLVVFLGAMAFLVAVADRRRADERYPVRHDRAPDRSVRRRADRRAPCATGRRPSATRCCRSSSGLLLLNRVIWLERLGRDARRGARCCSARSGRHRASVRRARADEPSRSAAAGRCQRSLARCDVAAQRARSTARAAFRQFLHQLRFDTASVLKSLPFLILLGFGLLNFISGARLLEPAVRHRSPSGHRADAAKRCGAATSSCWS